MLKMTGEDKKYSARGTVFYQLNTCALSRRYDGKI